MGPLPTLARSNKPFLGFLIGFEMAQAKPFHKASLSAHDSSMPHSVASVSFGSGTVWTIIEVGGMVSSVGLNLVLHGVTSCNSKILPTTEHTSMIHLQPINYTHQNSMAWWAWVWLLSYLRPGQGQHEPSTWPTGLLIPGRPGTHIAIANLRITH